MGKLNYFRVEIITICHLSLLIDSWTTRKWKKISSFLSPSIRNSREKEEEKKANDLLHSFQCQSITNTNSIVHPRDVV